MRKKIISSSVLLSFFICSLSYSQSDVKVKSVDKVNDGADQKTNQGVGQNPIGKDKAAADAKRTDKASTSADVKKAASNSGTSAQSAALASSEFKAYSKFDFISADKAIFYDDFSQDVIGDFPASWSTDGSGEVVSIGNTMARWLKLNFGSSYSPSFKGSLPDNYTLEFDAIIRKEEDKEDPSFMMLFFSSDNKAFERTVMPGDAGLNTEFWKECIVNNWLAGDYKTVGKAGSFNMNHIYDKKSHIAVWVQKPRLRIYVNETKIIDLPQAFPDKVKCNRINFNFSSELDQNEAGGEIFISNVRIGSGIPDMRNKLLTEGKLVSRGISFDVNSDKIKPESYGALKEIAGVLKDNPAVKVKIVGHTDSDGNAAANIDLSKRRASSVKTSLSRDFGIDESRMETDGKGAAEQLSPNTSLDGKVNNRRLEFIKL
jgi:OmpA-OmpF porin, OOP family